MRGNFLDKTKEGRLSKTAHDWGLKTLKGCGSEREIEFNR